ncbi:MAG: anti-sigma factor [Bacteroidia bacterium]
MNVNEIISSGLLESYVLGTATAWENDLVHDLCAKDPSLLKEIELIEEALINYSAKASGSINADLKNKISSKLFSNNKGLNAPNEAVIIPLKDQSKTIRLYKLGIVASIIFFITSIFYIFSLNQKIHGLSGELAKTNSSKTTLEEQLNTQQTALVVANSELQILSDPQIKTIALKGMNSLASNSALVHWNPENNAVYFHSAILPTAPNSKQYQLWAIIDGKPVDAGMINLTSDTTFQKMKSIKGAQAFAVTIENTGGSVTPTMDTMCLLGNV